MVRVDITPLLSDFRIMNGIGVCRVACLVLHVLLTQRGVDSYSTGPPISACGDMTPCSLMTYGVGPQTLSSSPYTVQPTVNCFSPGQTVYIYVDSSSFKGIFVEVKSPSDNNTNYGTFSTLPGDTDLKTMNCFGQSNSALSHTSNNLKSSKTFAWVAPQNYQGSDLQIVVTLVYNRTVYWVGIRTPMPVCGSDASIAPAPPASSSTTTTTTTTTTTPFVTRAPTTQFVPGAPSTTPFVPAAPTTTPFVAPTTQTTTRSIAPAASSTPVNPPSIPATTLQLQPQPSGGPVSFSADQYAYLRPKSRLCHRKHWLAVCRRW